MKRTLCGVLVAFTVSTPLAVAQTGDVNKILAETRAALGGEKKLAALKTFAATGQSTKVTGNTSGAPADVEMAFELPDKFMKKDVLTAGGPFTITRTSGFNGDAAINIVDQPPAGGNVRIIVGGPGGGAPGAPQTPEQQEEQRKQMLVANKREFARLVLGMLPSSPAAYPLQFSYVGQAESPDGKADVVEVKGEGDFVARLFIDTTTHLPLMISWMAKEPLIVNRTIGGGPGGKTVATFSGGGGQVTTRQAATPEEREKLEKELQDQRKEAEAKARVVEYRMYYGDYRDVDGVKVPFRMQRSIDGKPVEEVTLDKVKINGKIDPKKFQTQ